LSSGDSAPARSRRRRDSSIADSAEKRHLADIEHANATAALEAVNDRAAAAEAEAARAAHELAAANARLEAQAAELAKIKAALREKMPGVLPDSLPLFDSMDAE
jgi:chromosome segregation ATPase